MSFDDFVKVNTTTKEINNLFTLLKEDLIMKIELDKNYKSLTNVKLNKNSKIAKYCDKIINNKLKSNRFKNAKIINKDFIIKIIDDCEISNMSTENILKLYNTRKNILSKMSINVQEINRWNQCSGHLVLNIGSIGNKTGIFMYLLKL